MIADSVVAVISSYKPAASLVDHVRALIVQVSLVVVADDGSGPTASSVLDRLEDLGAHVLRRTSNDGIASTLNAGIAQARDTYAADWVLTLDQDTALPGDYVERLLSTAREALAAGLEVGAVSYARQNGQSVAVTGARNGFDLAYDPMQSGLLIPTSTFDAVGMLREDLFIDWVDSEFNERMAAAGLLTLTAGGTNIDHSLGEMRPLSVGGRPVVRGGRQLSVAYHPPVRAYYIARNGLLVARRSIVRAPHWTISRLGHDFVGHLARIVVGPRRGTLVLALVLGIADAARGRSGKMPAATQRRLS